MAIFVFHSMIAHHRLYDLTHPFLFDAAIIFVAVSGFMAGLVYGSKRDLPQRMVATVYRRVGIIAATHLGLMIALAAVLAVDDHIITDTAMRDFLHAPAVDWGTWLLAVLTMRHQPVLFDILPIYIVCLAVTPALILATATIRALLLICSWGLWIACWTWGWSQRDVLSGEIIHFALASWQAVFVSGCVVALERDRLKRWFAGSGYLFAAWVVFIASTVWSCVPKVLSIRQDLCWESVLDRVDMTVDLPDHLEKTTLHPLLFVSFSAAVLLWWRYRLVALAYLMYDVGPKPGALVRAAASRTFRMMALLGAHTLPVFAFGTLLCIFTAWLRFRCHLGEGAVSDGFTFRGMLIGQILVAAGIALQSGFAWYLERRRLTRSRT